MSEFYEAKVLSLSDKQVQVRLTVVSAEVQRFWMSKGFGLLLLVEPVLTGLLPRTGTIFGALEPDAVSFDNLSALKKAAPQIVKSCKLKDFAVPFPEYQARLAQCAPDEIARLLTDPSRVPSVTVVISLKVAGAGDHLHVGQAWRSGAFDIDDPRSGVA